MRKTKSSAARRWVGAGVVCFLIGAGVAYWVSWKWCRPGPYQTSQNEFWNDSAWVSVIVLRHGDHKVTNWVVKSTPQLRKAYAFFPTFNGSRVGEGDPLSLEGDLGTSLAQEAERLGVNARVESNRSDRGRPFLCLREESTQFTSADGSVTPNPINRQADVIVIPGIPHWMDESGTFVFPTQILWGPFAANSAIYGAPLFGAWIAAGWWTRRRRVKRGLCVACGYDLKGDLAGGCPECGRGRVQEARGTT